MTEFLLLLSLWPFHHKPKPVQGIYLFSKECYESRYCTTTRYGDWPTDQSKSGPIGRCGATPEDCISPDREELPKC